MSSFNYIRKESRHMDKVKQTKKLHNKFNRSITTIENLSNELFYEIFDYLDGCSIYQAFSNINQHFQQLLNSSCFLFKIKYYHSKVDDVFMNNLNQVICFKRQQIYSMDFELSSLYINEFFSSSFIIDSSLNHLESLFLHELRSNILMSVLAKLTSLPHLFSLVIYTYTNKINFVDIYRLIFNLPMLKYNKLTTDDDSSFLLPVATNNQQINSIEHLIINHPCTFDEIFLITSYTPYLHRLKFVHGFDDNLNFKIISPMTLSNLTYLSIHDYTLTFQTFERFIRKMNFKLKFLYILTECQDITYLEAHRWEKLILNNLSQLKNFSLQYREYIDDNFILPTYSGEINQFTSSFWIERQWLLQTEIDDEYIQYSIHSYKTKWYEYEENNIPNSSIHLLKSTGLNIIDIPSNDSDEFLSKSIKHILSITQIHHLEISLPEICIVLLIEILNLLSEINSLKIHSLSYKQPRNLTYDEFSTLNTKKITKFYIQQMIMIEEIFFFTSLFRYIVCLKVDSMHNMNIEYCLRKILSEIDDENKIHLRSLCFCVLTADDEMIKILKKMINDEELLINYRIKRERDKIYLQWK